MAQTNTLELEWDPDRQMITITGGELGDALDFLGLTSASDLTLHDQINCSDFLADLRVWVNNHYAQFFPDRAAWP